jgi:gas vesicle protein
LAPVSGVLKSVALLLLAFAALALAACGGNDDREEKNAYVREVNAAQAEFAQTVTTVSERITEKSSSSQDRKTLEQFQTAIDDVVTDLRDIKVPGAVDAEHAQLVEAMSGFGSDIRGAVSALRNPTQQNIQEARKTITAATQTVNVRIDAAIAAINSKLKS